MGRAIGIDLGTTNCCMAAMGPRGPFIIEDEETSSGLKPRVFPSYVLVEPSGTNIVGHVARREALKQASRVIYGAKRLMGRSFDDPHTTQIMETVPYQIVRGPDQQALIQVGEHLRSPQQVATALLSYLRQRASHVLNEDVTDAVITVPAHFDDNQRRATLEAGEAAGLNVLSLINEPTAAAIAFGFATKAETLAAVYDLGGGTFDLTVLHMMGDGVFDVVATGGDTFLGGSDFDNRLAVYLVRNLVMPNTEQAIDAVSMLRLKAAAEIAKITLSSKTTTDIVLSSFLDIPELKVSLSRLELEDMTRDLVTATINVCRATLDDAGVRPYELGGVLMVGGQTRMPAIQQAARAFFLKEPNTAMNPDEAVAAGAAIHAHSLSSEAAGAAPITKLLDVTPLTLGIRSVHDRFAGVIKRNSKVPCSVTRVFSTARDNQESVKIVVLQGENAKASQNTLLGSFVLDGIPPAPRLEPQINVTFTLDQSGILNVTAADQGTGESREITIQHLSESDEDVGDDVMLKDAVAPV